MNNSLEYVKKIIDAHQQISRTSCVPSSVEMILKLLGKVELDYCDQQRRLPQGSFADFDNQTLAGVTFYRVNLGERGPSFPFDQLFSIIDTELDSNRYIAIALLGNLNGQRVYHAYVIFDKNKAGNDFLAVTKAFTNSEQTTQIIDDVKNRVFEIQGTDILLYK